MKKLLFSFCLLLAFTFSYAASNVDSILVFEANNPIHNLKKENLRILDIGNSYTTDATHYLLDIATAAGATTGYSLYKAIRSGGSFKNWVDTYNDIDTEGNYLKHVAGDTVDGISTGNSAAGDGSRFRNALQNCKWDLILIHQVSTYATDFDSWNGKTNAGYLKEFIQIIRESNPQATIGFYLIHSYWGGYKGNTEKSSLDRWQNIANAIKDLRLNYGIDFIIPYGTAVQNLRASSLNDGRDFSTDGTHLADGLGDYVAACCYWQSVFAPRFGSIEGNTFRITDLDENTKGVRNVTDETAPIAQKAAILAVKNMYEVTNIDSFDTYMELPAELVFHKKSIIGYNYNRPAGDIIIPDGTQSISRAAFSECEGITSVSLPKSIRNIGSYAFKDCNALTSITTAIPQEIIFEIDTTVFKDIDKSKITLYVPYGASGTYTSTAGWDEFENISELAPEVFNLKVDDCGYATMYIDYAVSIPAGVEVYVVESVENEYANLKGLSNAIPARTAVIVKAAPGEYEFIQTIDEIPSIERNLLKGTLENEIVNKENGAYFVLANIEDKIGFYSPFKNSEYSFINNANKAYLFIENGQQSCYYLDYDYGNVTNIVNTRTTDTSDIIYDTAGRHIINPSRGIYIINGKKVLIK